MAIESVCGSVVSKIAELLVEPAIRQFRYMFCFNNFVQEFNEQKKKLALTLDRLQNDVKVAERNAEEIYKDVSKWLADANNEIEGVNSLENEIEKNGKCFTWCPNPTRQFKLSKALAKKTETMRKLEANSKFPKVSYKPPLKGIELLPSEEFTPSESSKAAFEQIMKALKDDNVNMIGLYGMGGVGKTTLVKEVCRRAKELQLFDEVLMATLSQNPNVMDIQDRVAERLALRFEEKTKEGRADRLWQRLKTEKKVLIVLDDVWKDIDFQEIGIPFGDDHRGCKILLTTRLEDMCSYMKCQPIVFLSLLTEIEAWALFKSNAGLSDEDCDLNRVAKEVARKCQGLPLALAAVGRALKGQSKNEWKLASKNLKKSQSRHMVNVDDRSNPYACLKLSYDYLKSKETKFCFLLCCLFPEDYSIPIENLTRYAVGYGLHKDAESIENAREQVYAEMKALKDRCMLLGTESEENVKMHDLFREVAIDIATKEYGFMVSAGNGWKSVNNSVTTISLMGNKLAELPEGLVCPQLKVLLLELDEDLNVPERFFEGMKAIEVLSLEGGCLSLQSLQFSTNLQSLLLRRCECKDLIWLRKLQRLEILGFIWCDSVEELPDEIGELKELRLLDLTGCYNLRRIPVKLIGRLKKLEELLIGDFSFEGWDVVGCDSTEGMNASLTELSSLSHLAVLSLTIPKVECIPRDFVFPRRLLKYDIVLGDGYSERVYPTKLCLSDISAASLNAKTFEQLFPTVSLIDFRNIEGLENIVLSYDQMTTHAHGSQKDFFQRLEHVEVKECGDIRTLFPAKWRQALKNLRRVEIDECQSLEEVFELDEGINEEKELSFLTELRLSGLPELKCIWKGPTRHVSLHSLAHLKLSSLDKLTFIFTPSLAQSLIHLETLQIDHCRGLKRLIREKDDEGEIIPESLGFPKLKKLSIRDCHNLEYAFPVSVSPSLQNLEEMEIVFADNLKQVFYSGEGDDIIVKSKIKDGIIHFPQLRKLSLSKCSFFGPKDFAAQLPSLQCLTIHYHEEWDDLLAQLRISKTKLFPTVSHICFWGVEGLRNIVLSSDEMTTHGHGSQKDFFQRLEHVEVRACGDIRTLFPAKWRQPLKNLSVEIEHCNSLEEVFELDEGINEEKELRLLSSLTRLRLSHLPELKCIWKGPTIHDSLHSLTHLKLRSLNKLTFIFTPSLAQSLIHLKTLWIEHCCGLKRLIREKDDEGEIILESLGFLKLKTLFISGCEKLEYVFPVSVSSSLQNLEEMVIDFAHNLKQVFYSEGDDIIVKSKIKDGVIDFPQLRKLSLFSVSSCSFFGPKDFAAQLPSLQELTIYGHREGLAQLQGFTSLETLELSYVLVPDLRCIWKDLVPCNLTTLEMERCERLTHVFTKSMIASLIQLEFLEISNCEELELIIAKDTDDEKDQILSGSDLQSSCFPNLCRLEITGCNKLKSLFPIAMAAGLKKLQILKVRESSQLFGVFGHDDHASPANLEKEMVLPDLQELLLVQLPSISCFSLGCYDFLFPHLETLQVHGCPTLTTIFGTTSNGSMSAQSEVLYI
ncbi:hypothetical protein POTOM_006868 [Populus tomentosa]|uniref:AAA+ ATPase domain-containing protein n=1 Tax=Populus tomentosa TaxID=118781 RepID=A0A8X8AK14_POPTO|nr:hypothetical protein POTOM_006868 [Populus tomentosa]